MKRVDLPAPLLFAWMALTVVLMLQGLRLAADRQAGFEPIRPATLTAGGEIEVGPETRELVYLGEPGPGLAVYQRLPQRDLLRWVEIGPGQGTVLLVPLGGLEAGEYLVTDAPERAGAASQEMDRPEQELRVHARFRVLPD